MGLNWIKRILESDARIEKRQGLSGIVVHYWDGGTPRACDVLNISMGGVYVQTNDAWYPDTVLKLMLQFNPGRRMGRAQAEAVALCVLARVVRSGSDGVGLEFLFTGKKDDARKKMYPECATDRYALRAFLAFVQQYRQNCGSR